MWQVESALEAAGLGPQLLRIPLATAPNWQSDVRHSSMFVNAVLRGFNFSRRGAAAAAWTNVADGLAQTVFRASEHLIVYGSLAPGGPNHGRLAALRGTWETGWVEGQLEEVGWGARLGFPALHWQPGGPRIAAHLLRSADLRIHWAELDTFEGAGYRRILVPFYSEQGSRTVGYLYEAASPAVA